MVKLWKQWCRLCAREDPNDTHIDVFLHADDEQSALADAINKCFSIDINNHDDWPQSICTKCHHLVTTITTFSQRTIKVQSMFAHLFNSQEDIDAGQLKVQYDLHDLGDVDMDLKLFANSPTTQLFESKPSMNADIPEQMIDLEEIEYIDEEMLNPTTIKTERFEEEEDMDANDGQWKGHITSLENDDSSYEYNSSDVESAEETVEEPKKKRGRPNKSINIKTEKQTFTCTECIKDFVKYQNYRQHMQIEHAVTLFEFPCSKCSKSFTTAKRLENHETTHQTSMPCPYCDKKFTKAVVVQAHIRAVHMDEKPFICEECGKTYKTFGSLKEHKLTHTEERPFKCTFCDKLFKTKSRLKTHEDTHNETNYICTTCGLQLNTRRTLKMHMVVHSDQKRHKCDYCGNEYKRAKALKNHLILHTGLKPYTCNFCEKSFANGSNCRSHKKKAHPVELAAMEAAGTKSVTTNIPKLEQLRAVTSHKAAIADAMEALANDDKQFCHDGQQDFSESVSVISIAEDLESLRGEQGSPMAEAMHRQQSDIVLKNHLTLQTGLKPYTCNFCEKSFANASNCRSHKKHAHAVELAAMEAAGTKSVTSNIPNLEQLRTVTSHKATFADAMEVHSNEDQQFCHDGQQDFSESVSVISIAEDLESLRGDQGSPMSEAMHRQQSDVVHAVFGQLSAS